MSESHISIGFRELDIDVYFDYIPEEKEIRYDSNGTGQQGCPAELIINKIEWEGDDITELIAGLELFYEVEEALIDDMEARRDDF